MKGTPQQNYERAARRKRMRAFFKKVIEYLPEIIKLIKKVKKNR